MTRTVKFILLAGILAASLRSASGFALLGPFAPWMTQELSYQDGYSIGGPMNIGEGYRWNVPVITYGYDQSFIDYFGTNGVAAVESAIQILNHLPPASTINLSNYPASNTRINHRAQAQGLMDLKSTALSYILEQMGLAQPTRFTYCLHDFTNATNYTVIMRNFDPVTLIASDYVDSTLYDYEIDVNFQRNITSQGIILQPIPPPPYVVDAVEYQIDPDAL